jgi:hypothetical protein
MTSKIDAKFYGDVFKVKNGERVPDTEYVVFLAKDTAFSNILPAYRAECLKLGSDPEQLAAVDRMMQRLADWRSANTNRLKVPDAAGEKLDG